MTRVLVVDNYDSFVYNLVQYLGQLGAEVVVHRNDRSMVGDTARVDGVLISPGPGTPQDAGNSMAIVRACARARCHCSGYAWGMQAIGAVYGAPIVRAPELLHGKTSEVAARRHRRSGRVAVAVHRDALPLAGGRGGGAAARDHRDRAHRVRRRHGVRHVDLPIDGVQFHPESVLTQGGHRMVANWLGRCGASVDDELVLTLGAEVEALRASAFAVA